MEAQATAGGAAGPVTFEGCSEQLVLLSPVPLPELRRHKRSFIKLVTQNSFSQIKSHEAATRTFVSYLADQLQQ